jgi:hypothetical protein
MRNNRALPCGTCGHAKSIHIRMYGPMYERTKLAQTCNFPGCRCKGYKAPKANPKR